MIQRTQISALGLVLGVPLFVVPSLGFCQIATEQEVDPAAEEPIDEIVVQGQKTVTALRLEMYKAQDTLFDIYNALNADDELDVYCAMEAPVGSYIRRRVCRVNIDQELAANKMTTRPTGGSLRDYSAIMNQKKKAQLDKLAILAAENPELLEALSSYFRIMDEFEGARKSK